MPKIGVPGAKYLAESPAQEIRPLPRKESATVPEPPPDLNCIHSDKGLCPECRADYDVDPEAWIEFGQHKAGIERWWKFQAELEAAQREEPTTPPVPGG